jgi:hypothetical protein
MAHKEFKQGIYKPINNQKYIGDKLPFYRSGYELKFMRWADANPNVLKWGSESIIVPYKSPIDGKMHRYFVDNVVIIKEGDNIKKYLIEIKPQKQTQPPTPHGNKKQTTILYEQATYIINQAKWEAARKWCKDHQWEFLILTEKHLP